VPTEGQCSTLSFPLALSFAPEMAAGLREGERLDQLRGEMPALSKVLTPQRIKAGFIAAFRGPQELERFEKELEEVSREIADTEK
jgi:hypothetical protein